MPDFEIAVGDAATTLPARMLLQNHLDVAAVDRFWVARAADGLIMGVAGITSHWQQGEPSGPLAWVEVAPAARRAGVGRALSEAAAARAGRLGARQLCAAAMLGADSDGLGFALSLGGERGERTTRQVLDASEVYQECTALLDRLREKPRAKRSNPGGFYVASMCDLPEDKLRE
ncbi:MAG: GNAT family N-acetyltransferase, partial [Planctomycetota bacterium]